MPCNKNEITCKLGKDDAYDKVDGDQYCHKIDDRYEPDAVL